MPAFGPSSDSIIDAAQQNKFASHEDLNNPGNKPVITPFQLIDVSSATLPITPKVNTEQFPATFLNRDYLLENQKIIPGDTLVIKIWEAANDRLFS